MIDYYFTSDHFEPPGEGLAGATIAPDISVRLSTAAGRAGIVQEMGVGMERFSEQLLRMDSLGFVFNRPQALSNQQQQGKLSVEQQKLELSTTRALLQRLGLQAREGGQERLVQKHLYICPQSLMKFHPSFDRTMMGLLEADPEGRIVLVYNTRAHTLWRQTLEARLVKSMGPVVAKVISTSVTVV
jgi:hypothetical protein